MKIRVATLDDYEELVDMYENMIREVYRGLKIREKIFFYGTVSKWFESGCSIVISEKDDKTITGFTLVKVEDIMIVEAYLKAELMFVKPEYRGGRSAHLLVNNILKLGKESNLPIIAAASNLSNSKMDKIAGKFGEVIFTEYLRRTPT